MNNASEQTGGAPDQALSSDSTKSDMPGTDTTSLKVADVQNTHGATSDLTLPFERLPFSFAKKQGVV